MNYHEINGIFYEANEGYIFQDKRDNTLVRAIYKGFINNYNCIIEPEPSEPEEVTEND